MTSDERVRQKKNLLVVAGVAAVLIALVLGLTLGKGQASDDTDPALSTKEIVEKAKQETLAEVKASTTEAGFEDGKKSGTRQGGRAGRRAGRSDGAVAAQLQITSAAESAAANAQAELDSISAAPPDPVAPGAGSGRPGR